MSTKRLLAHSSRALIETEERLDGFEADAENASVAAKLFRTADTQRIG